MCIYIYIYIYIHIFIIICMYSVVLCRAVLSCPVIGCASLFASRHVKSSQVKYYNYYY